MLKEELAGLVNVHTGSQ